MHMRRRFVKERCGGDIAVKKIDAEAEHRFNFATTREKGVEVTSQ